MAVSWGAEQDHGPNDEHRDGERGVEICTGDTRQRSEEEARERGRIALHPGDNDHAKRKGCGEENTDDGVLADRAPLGEARDEHGDGAARHGAAEQH